MLPVTVIILLLTSCSNALYKCTWQQNDFSKENHFKEPLKYYNPETKLEYNISNDNKNLYVCIKTNNNLSFAKIMISGLQIQIDTSGTKKTKMGILYPLPTDDSQNQLQAAHKPGEKQDRNEFRNQFLLKHDEMYITGFKPPINDNTIPLKNKYGIYVYFDWDSTNTMVYKLEIPFKTFYKDSLTAKDSSKMFGISFTVNAIPRPEAAEPAADNNASMPGMGMRGGMGGMNGMGGMRGGMGNMGAMGGGMGGGGHPGGNGSRGDNKGSPYESNTFKLKVKFAQNKL
jgi:hypothetical protein